MCCFGMIFWLMADLIGFPYGHEDLAVCEDIDQVYFASQLGDGLSSFIGGSKWNVLRFFFFPFSICNFYLILAIDFTAFFV